jgi:quercetin dioxygenase-like cupin family protein
MKILLILIAGLLSSSVLAQTPPQTQPSPTQDLGQEPHHKLIFQNDRVRVFQLTLQPHEATNPHRHNGFYIYLSLTPIIIGNEVRGRQPVRTILEAGEVHTSKGGFNLAERNESSETANLIVIEPLNSDNAGFTTPLGGFRYHDAAFGEIFEMSGVRAYTMTIAARGRTEPHSENYDRLIVAISDVKLRENVQGEKPSEVEFEPGEIKWIPRGETHASTNIGSNPATFVTFEFSTTGS